MPERCWAQVDAALAAHQAQLQQQKAQNDAIHLPVKTQGEIELAKIKAAFDAKMTVLETHLKAAIEACKVQRSYPTGAHARPGTATTICRTPTVPANICWSFLMDDYALVPVEHQPDFENVSLVPVEHDPFSDSGLPSRRLRSWRRCRFNFRRASRRFDRRGPRSHRHNQRGQSRQRSRNNRQREPINPR